MTHVKVKTKLVLGFAVVSVLTLVIGIIGIFYLNNLNDSYKNAIEIHGKPLVHMGYALVSLQKARIDLREAALYAKDQAELHALEDSVRKELDAFETYMNDYQKMIVRPDARQSYNEAMTIYDKTYKPACLRWFRDIEDGMSQEELMRFLRTTKPEADAMMDALMKTMVTKNSMLDKTYTDSTIRARTAYITFWIMIMFAAAVSVVLGVFVAGQVKEYLDAMDHTSHHLLQLITNVPDASDTESGMLRIDQSVFSLNAVLDKTMKTILPRIQEKNLVFKQHIDPSLPQSLLGNKDRLAKVIHNLLDNAVKFTPDEGEICFTARPIGADGKNITLQIEVADNGIGISTAQQGQLFDLFGQMDGHSLRKLRNHQSIGLGLTLAKRTVEAMGGKIWVESQLGKGAKFAFTCTVREPQEEGAA